MSLHGCCRRDVATRVVVVIDLNEVLLLMNDDAIYVWILIYLLMLLIQVDDLFIYIILICELTPSVGIVALWASADFQG